MLNQIQEVKPPQSESLEFGQRKNHSFSAKGCYLGQKMDVLPSATKCSQSEEGKLFL